MSLFDCRHHKHQSKTNKHVRASDKLASKSKKCGDKHNRMCFLKLKHNSDIDSDYLSAERLTKGIGIFNKGKISDSISRMEKRMPKKVRAQVNQDLKEVLKVTKNERHNPKRKRKQKRNSHSEAKSLPKSCDLSTYFGHSSGFASSAWEDKLQKSVKMDSVLASVGIQSRKMSPVHEEMSVAKKTLLTHVYPNIQKANCAMYPNASNRIKIKHRLLQIKSLFDGAANLPQNSLNQSNGLRSPKTSVTDESTPNSWNVMDDFELNPILTSEGMDHNFAEIFPPVSDYVEFEDNSSSSDVVFLPNSFHSSEEQSCPASSLSSKVTNGSVAFVPSTPSSSGNSPSWKLRFSPDVFKPINTSSSPKYFRHKMF